MARAFDDLENWLDDLEPMVSLLEHASSSSPAFSYLQIDPTVASSLTAGVIVLSVARFEEYLKQVGQNAMDQFNRASPPVRRGALPPERQVRILRRNVDGAVQSRRFGRVRTEQEILTEIAAVTTKIAQDQVWGDHAIATGGNPSPETIQEIMQLAGVSRCWEKLEYRFKADWAAAQSVNGNLPNVPSARRELESLLTSRNLAAHTSRGVALSSGDCRRAIEFLRCLGRVVEVSLIDAVDNETRIAGSRPGVWL